MKIKNTIVKINKAILLINNEISRHEIKMGTVSSLNQLIEFKKKLNLMLETLKGGDPPASHHLYFSRIIVDSWPLDSKLGELIIDAEESYIKLINNIREA